MNYTVYIFHSLKGDEQFQHPGERSEDDIIEFAKRAYGPSLRYPLVGQAVRRGRFPAFEFRFLPLRLCAGSAIEIYRPEHKTSPEDACLRSRAPRLCTLITFKLSRRDGNFDLNLS